MSHGGSQDNVLVLVVSFTIPERSLMREHGEKKGSAAVNQRMKNSRVVFYGSDGVTVHVCKSRIIYVVK